MFHFLFVVALSWAADKTSCTARELKNQDCRLVIAAHQIRLLSDTIARDLGTAHVVDPMPLKGDWEKMTFEITHGRPILQLWIWDNGKGEAPVQSLRWYTADARPGAIKVLAEGVVRRRRLKPTAGRKKRRPISMMLGRIMVLKF